MNRSKKPSSAATKEENLRYGGHPAKHQMPIMNANKYEHNDNLNPTEVFAQVNEWVVAGEISKEINANCPNGTENSTDRRKPRLSMRRNAVKKAQNNQFSDLG